MNPEIEILCPTCNEKTTFNPITHTQCPECRAELIQHPTSIWEQKKELEQCLICGETPLFRQKDFNRKLGLALVVLGIIFSFWTYGLSLVLVTVIDWILYKRVEEVGVCYHCQAVYRDLPAIAKLSPFRLEIHDYYRSRSA